MPGAAARKTTARTAPTGIPGAVPPASRVAVPEEDPAGGTRLQEPVWLVRSVLVLFLIGFAAFLARELRNFLSSLP